MKKELSLTANKFQVNDEIVGVGLVKAVSDLLTDPTPFAYENHRGELVATAWSNIYEYDVEREVDEEEFRVRSVYIPSSLYASFENTCEGSERVNIVITDQDDGETGLTVDKAALKAVVEKL